LRQKKKPLPRLPQRLLRLQQLHRLLPLHPLTLPLQPLQQLPQQLPQQLHLQRLLPSKLSGLPALAGMFIKKPRCAGFFCLSVSAKFSGDQFEDPFCFAGLFGLAIGVEDPDQGLA